MNQKREVLRTCCGCRQQKNRKELIRLYLDEEKTLRIDRIGKAGGRGVYICRQPDCLKRAVKTGAVARGLRQGVSPERLQEVVGEIGTLRPGQEEEITPQREQS